jgi:hypothetical protein
MLFNETSCFRKGEGPGLGRNYFSQLKFGPHGAGITCFTRISGPHCIDLRKCLTPVSPATSDYISRLCLCYRTSLFIIMSFIYAKLLVVICIAYVISEVVTHRLPLHYYEVRANGGLIVKWPQQSAARDTSLCACVLQIFGSDDWIAWNALTGCCCYGDETLKSKVFQSWAACLLTLTDIVVEM